MLVCALGDLLVDVVVRPDRPPVPGGDVTAAVAVTPGGQAANVAAWVAALGGRARLVARRSRDQGGRLVEAALTSHGVEIAGPVVDEPTGTVVSLLDAAGERTMLSDRGAAAGLTPGE